jgi:hypothetical protein
LAFSWILAVWVFHSIWEDHWCFQLWCLRQCRNCSNPGHILEWCQTCWYHWGDGHGVLRVAKGRYSLSW